MYVALRVDRWGTDEQCLQHTIYGVDMRMVDVNEPVGLAIHHCFNAWMSGVGWGDNEPIMLTTHNNQSPHVSYRTNGWGVHEPAMLAMYCNLVIVQEGRGEINEAHVGDT